MSHCKDLGDEGLDLGDEGLDLGEDQFDLGWNIWSGSIKWFNMFTNDRRNERTLSPI